MIASRDADLVAMREDQGNLILSGPRELVDIWVPQAQAIDDKLARAGEGTTRALFQPVNTKIDELARTRPRLTRLLERLRNRNRNTQRQRQRASDHARYAIGNAGGHRAAELVERATRLMRISTSEDAAGTRP